MIDYRIVKPNEPEWKKLTAAAKIMESFSKSNARYDVEETYLDFGQNWKWTTIIRHKEDDCWGGVQVLSPRNWEEIVTAETNDQLSEAVDRVMHDKYYND